MLLQFKKNNIWVTMPIVKTRLCFNCYKTTLLSLKNLKLFPLKVRDIKNSENLSSKFTPMLFNYAITLRLGQGKKGP